MDSVKIAYELLLNHYGLQKWWPSISQNRPFEIMIGAILTQNTSWKNVELAIINLHEKNLIDPLKLVKVPIETLEILVRPSGYFRQKAERLHILSSFIVEKYEGNVENMKKTQDAALRNELLGLKGIGPETADAILLYGLNKPAFVVDAYARRVFSRIGICNEQTGYYELQQMFLRALPKKSAIFNQYHALIVQHGKLTCTKKAPACSLCPLIKICNYGQKSDNI